MRYRTLLFDLDDTLYPSHSGLWLAIRERMTLYMQQRLGVPAEQVRALRQSYYQAYGTTLRGLQIHFQVDADDYLTFVHDLPLDQYIHPVPGVRQMILSLPQKRWIFTNADADHARRVLDTLDLVDCFHGIIDIKALEYHCKPGEDAYKRALSIAGEDQASMCVILDDSWSNLQAANRLGFTTVLVGQNGQLKPENQLFIEELSMLPQLLPELWERD